MPPDWDVACRKRAGGEPRNGGCAGRREMRVVLTSFGKELRGAWSEPHVQALRILDAGGTNQRVGQRLKIDQRHSEILRDLAHHDRICAVRILERAARIELSPNDWCEENWDGASGARFAHEPFEVAPVGALRRRVPSRVFRLFVVVAELNEEVVARLQLDERGVPLPFVDEALRASTIDGVVVDKHAV